MEGIIDKEEEIVLVANSNLFMLRTITLLKLEILNAVIFGVEVSTKDLKFNFPHFEGKILVDTIPAHIKVQELEITQWTLLEDHQI
jgi:hypothetical protein